MRCITGGKNKASKPKNASPHWETLLCNGVLDSGHSLLRATSTWSACSRTLPFQEPIAMKTI